jgi:hypothetical protein
MTATELKKRAIALAEKTKIDSVTPEEVGQLSNDIVEYIENVEINGSSLGIRKTYTSVSAMEADSTAPKDDKGVLLRRGMLVNIYNQSDQDSADNGKVFSFQNPGWAFRGTIDAGYATKEELTELSDDINKKVAALSFGLYDKNDVINPENTLNGYLNSVTGKFTEGSGYVNVYSVKKDSLYIINGRLAYGAAWAIVDNIQASNTLSFSNDIVASGTGFDVNTILILKQDGYIAVSNLNEKTKLDLYEYKASLDTVKSNLSDVEKNVKANTEEIKAVSENLSGTITKNTYKDVEYNITSFNGYACNVYSIADNISGIEFTVNNENQIEIYKFNIVSKELSLLEEIIPKIGFNSYIFDNPVELSLNEEICIKGNVCYTTLEKGQRVIFKNDGTEIWNDNSILRFAIGYIYQTQVIPLSEIRERINLLPTKSPNIIYVDKRGYGDYTTIQEAVNKASTIDSQENPVTIVIYPGIYEESVKCNGRRIGHNPYISLIGLDKVNTIIRDDYGHYNNAPLEFGCNGVVKNLTVVSTHEKWDEKYTEDEISYQRSYALHHDWEYEGVAEYDNCIFVSRQAPAVGAGTKSYQTLIIRNCEIRNDSEDWSSTVHHDAMLLHNGNNAENQNVSLINNIFKCKIGFPINMKKTYNGEIVNVLCVGNACYSDNKGTEAYVADNYILDKSSYNNQSDNINYKVVE